MKSRGKNRQRGEMGKERERVENDSLKVTSHFAVAKANIPARFLEKGEFISSRGTSRYSKVVRRLNERKNGRVTGHD